ncbi:MAG: hypothetical protein FWE14_00050 [Lachnospiraceae bacterium]|nr:hypothetical protein [Lachnospiraceae bacterium]
MAVLTTPNLADGVTTAVTEGLTGVATSAGGILLAVVGIAIGIFAGVFIAKFGMRLFNKLKPA